MSSHDPLARFKQIQHHGTSADPVGFDAKNVPTPYSADGKPHDRLRIRTFVGIIYAPGYRYLMDVMSNEEGTQINLVFSHLMVRIRGVNLQPLALAIEDGTCFLIHDFHPNDNHHPKATETVIEEIFVKARDDDDMQFPKQ